MAADVNNTPKHGRPSAGGRHAAPRSEARVSEESVDALFEEARAAAGEGAASSAGSVAGASSEPLSFDEAVPTPAPAAHASSVSPLQLSDEPLQTTQVDGDQELQMGDAPAPIGVDPEVTGSFQRITADQGARVTTRANASETASFRAQGARPIEAVRMSSTGRPHVERHETNVESNTRVFAMIGAAVVVVVAIVGWLLVRALVSVDEPTETVVAEQVQVGVGEALEYRGVTYMLAQQDDGVYALTSSSEDQEGTTTICTLTGTPAALILYNTAFVIPENLNNNTWDLIAHHLGSGSMTQQVTGADGSAIIGTGEIASARLEGSTIIIETTTGEQSTVMLESE